MGFLSHMSMTIFLVCAIVASAKSQDIFGFASIMKREGEALAHFLCTIHFGIETIIALAR
jgi:hypothetical protein